VTHDQEEAMTMADTIAVMNAGKIEQMGAPQEIYDTPLTAFAANFLGQSNLIPGEVVDRGDVVGVQAFGQRINVPSGKMNTTAGRVIVGVRPEKLHLHRQGAEVPEGRNTLTGVVTDASFVGVSTQYLVATPWGQELIAFEQNMSSADRPLVGDTVTVSWEPTHSFGLDGRDNLNAGIEEDLLEVGPYTATDAEAGVAPTPVLGG
jgi:spermidine/putrescine transport system ATP-binding protein